MGTMNVREIIATIMDVLVATPIILGIFYIAYLIIKGHDINKALTKNPKHLLESIIVFSSLLEILALSIIGLDRGISLSACLSRYGMAAILEILFAFVFSSTVAKCFADKKITLDEMVSMTLSFLLSVSTTALIYWFYLESNGNVTFLGWSEYDEASKSIELGALFTIWCTVPLNLVNIYFQYKYTIEDIHTIEIKDTSKIVDLDNVTINKADPPKDKDKKEDKEKK